MFADAEGNIGYALAGKIPAHRQASPAPVEGWNDDNDWRGFIPFEEMPRLFNPPGGVIATANNQIVDSSYPLYLSRYFEPPYRVRRIEELLAAREKHSPDDLTAIQMDTVSLHARTVIEILRNDLCAIEDSKNSTSLAPEAARRLLHWDGDCSASSVAAAIFHVFHHRLLSNLLIDTLGEQLFSGLHRDSQSVLGPHGRDSQRSKLLMVPISPAFSLGRTIPKRDLCDPHAKVWRKNGALGVGPFASGPIQSSVQSHHSSAAAARHRSDAGGWRWHNDQLRILPSFQSLSTNGRRLVALSRRSEAAG